ncbi:nuclear transport factor 2 family protein [Thalassolituus sp. LLYu03]|uniref:nuclear transport factor 2 family protein n=1 Tax=Thalassolituus sp. LLYu03 TaxID=3421656 RepID=UPI003D29FDBF
MTLVTEVTNHQASTPEATVAGAMSNRPLSGTASADDYAQINHLIRAYFTGLHEGDSERLRRIFHADAVLKAPGLRRTLAEWLALVNERETPQQRGDAFSYQLLAMEVLNGQAMVKVLCPLLGRTYIDFLGLLKEQGKWLIVNKMYADL